MACAEEAWAGITSIVMTKNTIHKGDSITSETRYFISSLPVNVQEAAGAIRGHWMVESYHWHLDVTFREDASHTLNKAAAYNLNPEMRVHAFVVKKGAKAKSALESYLTKSPILVYKIFSMVFSNGVFKPCFEIIFR